MAKKCKFERIIKVTAQPISGTPLSEAKGYIWRRRPERGASGDRRDAVAERPRPTVYTNGRGPSWGARAVDTAAPRGRKKGLKGTEKDLKKNLTT